jgi:dihydroorotate dehydrogenase (fumarate)
MADLRTTYLGLELKNPLVPSASPLSRDLDAAKRLEDAGASAIVMYSLFEEEVLHDERSVVRFLAEQDIGYAESSSFLPEPVTYKTRVEEYLEQLAKLKESLDIPVIASLNGISASGWIQHGKELQEAGADALELNVYYVAADAKEGGAEVESRYVELLHDLKGHVSIPITMKLSPQFSSVAHMVRLIDEAGADGVALFNRFYQPDIDLETLGVVHRLQLSNPEEALLRIRWIAILFGRVKCSLAITGGVHTADTALKALLAGADVIHLCSALLQHGPEHLGKVLKGMEEWLEELEYESVEQLKGSVSQARCGDPAAYERANYVNVLDSYSPPPGVRR